VPSLIATRVRAYLAHFQIDKIGANYIEEDSMCSYREDKRWEDVFS